MIKISGGYTVINPNFVISEIEKKEDITPEQRSIFAVLENILLRGVPTKPSKTLYERIGEPEKTGGYRYTYGDKPLCWDNVIKGGTKNGKEDNPARDFYKRLTDKSKDIKYKNFIRTFLPECRVNQILQGIELISDKKAVDFYSPFYRIDIEIDGSQHGSGEQGTLDSNRDKNLRGKGVEIKRIHTTELQNKEKIREIAKWIDGQKTLIEIDDLSSCPNTKRYLYIFRLQLVFLHLFKQGKIPLREERFSVKLTTPGSDKEFCPEVFDLALDDLFQWLENLFTLADLTFEKPQIVLSEQDADLEIDLDPYSFYDQTIYDNDGIVRVRNDYFPYDREANTDPKKYAGSKNYYQVATALDPNGKVIFPFQNADASNPKHEAALTFFLKNLFGFEGFREKQLEIVAAELHPENGVIGILPTGSGKSVCYQLVSFLTPAVSLVISPLKVLMDDQVKNLSDKSISTAERIHGSSKKIGMKLFDDKKVKLLYVSPERFFSFEFKETIEKQQIGQINVDEVHCLSEWGHDFRTSYLLLFSFLKEMPWGKDSLLMGTTATASPLVADDIINEFSTVKEKDRISVIFADSVKRPKLTLMVERVNEEGDREKKVKELVDRATGKTLIFTLKTKDAEIVSSHLDDARFYHGKNAGKWRDDFQETPQEVDRNEIEANQERTFSDFKEGVVQTLVATKAFGMGVDIPDIRQTIHYHMPGSVESLYQEMGRAGRDGKNANCTVLLCNENAENIKKAFEMPFSLENLQKINNQQYLYGDIATPVYFMLQNSGKNIRENARRIWDVYEKIKSGTKDKGWKVDEFKDIWKSNGQKDQKKTVDQTIFEKSLYKLYILGVINLWKVTYGDDLTPTYSNLSINDISDDQIHYNLETHIQKYDYIYRFHYTGTQMLANCILELCKWDNENFLKARWESLRFLYDIVSKFKNPNDFADRIEQFFSKNEALEEAIKEKTDVSKWFKFLYATETHLAKNQIARQMEQHSMYPFLNLVCALVAIKNKEFESEKERLLYAFSNFETDEAIGQSLKESIHYLESKPKDVETFLYFLADEFPAFLDYESVQENAPEKSLEKAKKRAEKNKLRKSLERLKSVMNNVIQERKTK